MKTAPQIAVVPDPAALAQEAARRFTRLAKEAVENRGHFSAALSGGSTPGRLYRRLAEDPHREEMPWEYVHLFWGDERCVAPEHPGSNFRLANEALISHVPIPPGNVHRVRGELEPEAAAQNYAAELHAFFGASWPRFDLVLLGLGQDGHTASLYPGSRALEETRRLVIPVEAPPDAPVKQRITLSLPAINNASNVMFLVSGAGKARILKKIITESEEENATYPASMVKPQKGLHLMTDIDVVTDIDEY